MDHTGVDHTGETERRPFLILRLALGSLAATAGLLVLGGILFSTSASAADASPEPADNSSLDGTLGSALGSADDTISSVVTSTTDALGSATSSVTPMLPKPVASVVDSAASTVDVVTQAVQTRIVSQVVTPIANTADDVIGANRLPGVNPVATPASPATRTVDDTIGTIGGTVSAPGHRAPAASASPKVASGFSTMLRMSSSNGGPELQEPLGSPLHPAGIPALNGATGSANVTSGGSGGVSTSAVVPTGADFSHYPVSLSGVPNDDVLPSSPAATHDSAPD